MSWGDNLTIGWNTIKSVFGVSATSVLPAGVTQALTEAHDTVRGAIADEVESSIELRFRQKYLPIIGAVAAIVILAVFYKGGKRGRR